MKMILSIMESALLALGTAILPLYVSHVLWALPAAWARLEGSLPALQLSFYVFALTTWGACGLWVARIYSPRSSERLRPLARTLFRWFS